jgi:hypothetical protein
MVRKLFKRLEDIYVAVTFAEAGEFDKARQVMTEKETSEQRKLEIRKIVRERMRHVR